MWGPKARMGALRRCPSCLPEPQSPSGDRGLQLCPSPVLQGQEVCGGGLSRQPAMEPQILAPFSLGAQQRPAQNSPLPSQQLDLCPDAWKLGPQPVGWPCPAAAATALDVRPAPAPLSALQRPNPSPFPSSSPGPDGRAAAPPGGPALQPRCARPGRGRQRGPLPRGPARLSPQPLPAPLLRLPLPSHPGGREGRG